MGTIAGLVDGSGSFFSAASQLVISNFLDQMFLIYGCEPVVSTRSDFFRLRRWGSYLHDTPVLPRLLEEERKG